MTPPLRWLVVALVTIGVVSPAVAPRVWPVGDEDVSASALAAKVRKADGRAWFGEVHTQGSLSVPDADSFGNVATLFGEDTDLRVWWADDAHWRVDRTRGSGESDLVRNDARVVRWSYESRRATTTRWSPVRLPDESDLLPARLASTMLQGARKQDLARLPARRVDGHAALGLRIRAYDARSTLSHVDLWVDKETSFPLRAEVYGAGSDLPVVTSTVTSFSLGTPPADTTRFAFPDGVKVRVSYAIDDTAGANAFAPFIPPATVAGLPRNPATQGGAVGVYGKGMASLVLVPLRRNIARDLFRELAKSKQSTRVKDGIALSVGPLSILLKPSGRGTFLMAGWVTPSTLESAIGDLAGVRYAPRDYKSQARVLELGQ